MALTFITGNLNKFNEVKDVLSDLEQKQISLPEIQSLDPKEIIEGKLKAAFEHEQGEFIVEDTSLYFDALGGKLPGPFVKWFEEALDLEGLANLAQKMESTDATAKVLIGYAKNSNEIHYFEGSVKGFIVPPRGTNDFGWGPIFEVEGTAKTYGEMSADEKKLLSPRRLAAEKLKQFLMST